MAQTSQDKFCSTLLAIVDKGAQSPSCLSGFLIVRARHSAPKKTGRVKRIENLEQSGAKQLLSLGSGLY